MNKIYKELIKFILLWITMMISINESISQVTDIDGKNYKNITIGTQEWMAENLNVEHYRNGDPIPQVQDKVEWSKLKTGAWCYYENNSENGKTYGKLYNWYAINDSRGLAPEGWHIPSDAEWTTLTDYLGGTTKEKNEGGIKYWIIEVVGGKLKATTLWDSPNTGATNSSGLTAFPGGFRIFNGDFGDVGEYGIFWSSSEYNFDLAWYRSLSYGFSDVYRSTFNKYFGLSVRCVRD